MVVTIAKVIEAQVLASRTSVQRAELIVLTKGLVLSQRKKVNIYIDGIYAFMAVHVHGAIWKERGLLTSRNKDVKHAEILQLLVAVNLLNQVAIMNNPERQRHSSQMSQGNQTADKAARQAVRRLPHLRLLIPYSDLSKFKPQYIEQDEEWAYGWGFTNTDPNSIWKIDTHGTILLSETLVYPIPSSNTYM